MKPTRSTYLAALDADDWTTRCDQEAAFWLKQGLRPDQLDPASGVPLHLDRRDPHMEPSMAEAALRMDEAEMAREDRRERWQQIGVALGIAAIVAAVALLIGSGVLS